MKTFLFAVAVVFLAAVSIHGQGFIYDQQSADESGTLEGSIGLGQQPLGQSFTPTLSSIGFIRLYIFDGNLGGSSVTISIDLRTNSIAGAVLNSTAPIALPSQYSGFVDFYFSTPEDLTAGATYCFQPVVQSGGGFGTLAANYNYPGGVAYANGVAAPPDDLWFREGIVTGVPEPSSVWLVLLGGGSLLCFRRHSSRRF